MWPKTMEINSFVILESQSLQKGVGRGHDSAELRCVSSGFFPRHDFELPPSSSVISLCLSLITWLLQYGDLVHAALGAHLPPV